MSNGGGDGADEEGARGDLIGIGLYTTAEAARLLHMPAGKLGRWLRGHRVGKREYAPLWQSQVDIGDGHVYLGFRDLMEARVADAFISMGVSSIAIRRTIDAARELFRQERPLANSRFRTDGRRIFLETIAAEGTGEPPRLLDILGRQYAFKQVLDPVLRTVDFDADGEPRVWWPKGKAGSILIDPNRSFGHPIDAASGVPTSVLAEAGSALGIEQSAEAWRVSPAAVRHAIAFEAELAGRLPLAA